ncbi:MAG: tetratricopeptide repeat protein, partial [Candidatus Heimdallarchaeaceae archaeon]
MSNPLIAQIEELFEQQKYREVSNIVSSNLVDVESADEKKRLLLFSAQSNYFLSKNKQALEDILNCKKLMSEVSCTNDEIIDVEIQRAKILRRLGEKEKSLHIYDKILKVHQESIEEDTKATIFHNLANLYLEKGNFEQSKTLFEQAIEIDKGNKNEKGLAQSFSGLGGLFFYLGEYDQAIDYYRKSLKIRSKNKDLVGEATLLFNLGSTYANMLSEKNALSYLTKAERIFRKLEHHKGEYTVLDSKARMFYNLKNYPAVIKNLRYLQSISVNSITSQNLPMFLLLIDSLLQNGDTSKADIITDKALEAAKAFDEEKKKSHISEIANLMHMKSQYLFKNEQYENSLNVLEELEKLATLFHDDKSLIAIHFSKSQILYVTDNLSKAKKLAQTGLKIASKHKDPTSIAFLDLLFGIDWKQSNFSECIISAKELSQYVQINRKPVLETIIRTLQLAENEKPIKTHSKERSLLFDEIYIPLFYLDVLSIIYTSKLTLAKLERLANNFKSRNSDVEAKLSPYFLLMLNLIKVKQEEREKFLPSLQNESKLHSLMSRIARRQVLTEDIRENIEKIRSQKTVSFQNMMLILDIIYYSIVLGFISKKYLLEFK